VAGSISAVGAATAAASAWVLTVASINSRTDSYNARCRSTSSALMFSSVKSSMKRN